MVNNTTEILGTGDNVQKLPVAYIVLLLLLVLTGTAANAYLIAALTKRKHRSPHNMAIVILAIIDVSTLMIVVPSCISNLLRGDRKHWNCPYALGLFLVTYSFHIQCIILYMGVRRTTTSSPWQDKAFGWIKLGVVAGVFFVFDISVTVIPTVLFQFSWTVPGVGHCYFFVRKGYQIVSVLLSLFYGANTIGTITFSIVLYVRLVRYIRKNSTSSNLARQRNLRIFKLMFRKFLIWGVCYSLAAMCKLSFFFGNWPAVIFQIAHFLVWVNSVINPMCHILMSSAIISWCRQLRARVTPLAQNQETNVFTVRP